MASTADKKQKARSLYITGEYSQKEISELVGVSEKTISKWKNNEAEDWDGLKDSMLTSRENELKRLYKILKSITEFNSAAIDAGGKADAKDADAVIKYSAAIRNLEIETSIAEMVEVGMRFINYVRKEDVELSKTIAKWFDVFLKQQMK